MKTLICQRLPSDEKTVAAEQAKVITEAKAVAQKFQNQLILRNKPCDCIL